MFIVVVGGGKVGSNLARMLAQEGHEAVVVERDPRHVAELAETMPDLRVVEGDGCLPSILELAHISRADALAAVTGCDEDNLGQCLLARREYAVPVTAARVNDPRSEWLFDAAFGVDHALSGTRAMAEVFTRDVEAPSDAAP